MSTSQASEHEWLTTEELAELLKVPVQTVRAWRHNGSGPAAVRLGRHVRYRRSTVGAWIAANEQAQRRNPDTGQEPEAGELRQRPGDQPLPVRNDTLDIQSQVIADIEERRKLGSALQPHNGRDALRDAYEEAIDLAMYLKQAIVERDTPKETRP